MSAVANRLLMWAPARAPAAAEAPTWAVRSVALPATADAEAAAVAGHRRSTVPPTGLQQGRAAHQPPRAMARPGHAHRQTRPAPPGRTPPRSHPHPVTAVTAELEALDRLRSWRTTPGASPTPRPDCGTGIRDLAATLTAHPFWAPFSGPERVAARLRACRACCRCPAPSMRTRAAVGLARAATGANPVVLLFSRKRGAVLRRSPYEAADALFTRQGFACCRADGQAPELDRLPGTSLGSPPERGSRPAGDPFVHLATPSPHPWLWEVSACADP